MKTTFKTLTSNKKAIEKRKAFEDKTGLKWDYYSTGQGYRFTPIVIRETSLDADHARNLKPYLTKNYQEFVKLAKISGIKLEFVLIGAKTLVKNNQAVPTVNRMGNFFAIRKKHIHEEK